MSKPKPCKACGGHRGISLRVPLKYDEIKSLCEGLKKVREGSEEVVSIMAISKKKEPMELAIGRHPETEFMMQITLTVDVLADRIKRILEAEQN